MKAVILAGGQGTRFWPVSRRHLPKQFLSIAGSRTLLQETVDRLLPFLNPADIHIVCSSEYVEEVGRQLPELAADQVIVEPVARNTAPCIGLAAVTLQERYPDEIMAVLPADHVIRKVDVFHRALSQAEELAREDWLVTFGIPPSYPATAYGYLERGRPISLRSGTTAYQVARFAEKPDAEKARAFLAGGRFYWNSGMFVWSIRSILDRMAGHMPDLYAGLRELQKAGSAPAGRLEIFSRLERISIDYGVMEKDQRVALLPCDLGWSDVGGWRAVAELKGKDAEGISSNTPYLARSSRDSIIHAGGGKMVVLLGVEGLLVVDTDDALLVCPLERAEELRSVVEELERRNLGEYL